MKLFQFGKKNSNTFKCECCGIEYDEIPLCFGSDYPDYYYSISPDERGERIEMKESLCVIDKKYFFHRGRLIIPIINFDKDLIFNVWTSISEENFRVRMDLWEDPNRVNHQPYFGWLQTNISTYGGTLNKRHLYLKMK